jgi:hypothetical protein
VSEPTKSAEDQAQPEKQENQEKRSYADLEHMTYGDLAKAGIPGVGISPDITSWKPREKK